MKSILKYSNFKTINEERERGPQITKGDERIDVVDNFIQCIGYPGQGTHAASDWASGNAWDLAAPVGSNVYSLFDGKVSRVRKSPPGMTRVGVKKIFGDQVSIDTLDPSLPDVFYTHIDSVFTSADQGKEIKKGDVVGTIMTLPGMPSHLHIGLAFGNLLDYLGDIPQGTKPDQTTQVIASAPQTYPSNYKTKVYSIINDPYKYTVIGGVWYAKDGLNDAANPWQLFQDWTSLEKNHKMNQVLDKRYVGARKSTEIELNRQKFASNPNDITTNRSLFFESIGAPTEIVDLGTPMKSNNNPCNIKFDSDYLGLIGNSNGYCKFKSEGFGLKAAKTLLENLYDNSKLKTIRQLISRITIIIEHDIVNYLSVVSSQSGFGLDQVLDRGDLVKLIPPIVELETLETLSQDDVLKEIQKADSSDPRAEDSTVYDGDYSIIYTPIGFQDVIPIMIFNPKEEDSETMRNFVLDDFQELFKNTMVVFPLDDNQDIDSIFEDISEALDDNDLEFKNITSVFYGKSLDQSKLDSYSTLSNLVNLVLINPPMSDSILDGIKNLPKETNLFLGYDYEDMTKQSGKDNLTKFVVKFKEIMKRNQEEPDQFVKEYQDIKETDLIRKTINDFLESIKLNINA